MAQAIKDGADGLEGGSFRLMSVLYSHEPLPGISFFL